MNLIEIKILNAAVERQINHELADINLTFVQAMVIQYLHHHKEVVTCQKDIQKALGLTHSTVSSILNRMEERKLIRTETLGEDKRYKALYPTGESRDLYQKINVIVNDLEGKIFHEISIGEQEMVSGIFQKMLLNMDI